MKKRNYKGALALLTGVMLAFQGPLGALTPVMESHAYTEKTGKVNATTLNVRSAPGSQNSLVGKLSHGTSVTVIGEQKASDGALWYQIRFSGSGGTTQTGYVLSTYIKFPTAYTSDSDFEAYLTSQGFPESYKAGLRQLHAEYPNWVFTAQNTGLDWNAVIENESVVTRNLVYKTSISSWKSTADGAYNWETSTWPGFDGPTWVAASEDIIRYYMDPRNFLDDTYVFQFLLQSYDGTAQTAAGLQSLVSGTFLAGGSSDGSGGGSSDGPGSSGGPGVSPADSDSGSSENTGGPGGSSSDISSDGPAGSGGPGSVTSPDGSGTGSSGPEGSSDSEVKFIAPQASNTVKETNRVASSFGPGMSGGPGGDSGNSGSAPSSGSSSYVDIIMNAGAQSGVNPYVLGAMILQEQGTQGTSDSISGTASGYEGYYNFFNIEAYQSGSLTAVQRGLWYAGGSSSDISSDGPAGSGGP
ncbi:MAG: SH3 domain-containing protein, partial [Lachnospiraceae bacterium]